MEETAGFLRSGSFSSLLVFYMKNSFKGQFFVSFVSPPSPQWNIHILTCFFKLPMLRYFDHCALFFFFFDVNNRCISPHSSGGGESGSRCEQGGLLWLLSLEMAASPMTSLGLPFLVLLYFRLLVVFQVFMIVS